MAPDQSEGAAGKPTPDRAELHPVDWAAQDGVAEYVLREMRIRVRRRRSRRLGAAAAAAVAVAAAAFIAGKARWHSRVPETSAAASAIVSIPARRFLPDGSVIELREGAAVSVAFSASVRRVVLSRGEALFHVAKDARRPFVVQAGGVQVRAIGTAFAVDLGGHAVDVLVTEGRVAVDRSSDAELAAPALAADSRTLALVDAGHELVVGAAADARDAARVSAVGASDLSARLAWRIPRLEFSGTPLSQVIAAVNRYSPIKLTLADPSLGGVQLSGVMRADHINTLIELLEEVHGIRAERRGEHEILLSKAR
jgi:transmembrane sensor